MNLIESIIKYFGVCMLKLLKVQSELRAPKNQYNSFGKYKYRNAEDILEAVKPLLLREGLLLNISDEIIMIGDRYYVKSTVTVTDVDTKESVVSTSYAREEEAKKGMDGSQITGASSSYARKYALNGMFAIDDNKDSDYTNTHKDENIEKFQIILNEFTSKDELITKANDMLKVGINLGVSENTAKQMINNKVKGLK